MPYESWERYYPVFFWKTDILRRIGDDYSHVNFNGVRRAIRQGLIDQEEVHLAMMEGLERHREDVVHGYFNSRGEHTGEYP